METTRLQQILQKAIQAGIREKSISREFNMIYPGFTQFESDDLILQELEEFLRGDPQIAASFDGKMIYFGNSGRQMELSQLVKWLLKHTYKNDPRIAAENLERYLSTRKVSGYDVLVISGISVSGQIELGKDITLIPFDHLSESLQKAIVQGGTFGLVGFQQPILTKAALVCPNAMVKRDQGGVDFGSRFLELEEACLWLTLVGPSSPLLIAGWWEPEEWVPLAGMGGSLSSRKYDIMHGPDYSLLDSDVDKAKGIFKVMSTLAPEIKAKLSIPIRRLNQAIRREQTVDSAIELGVALEALFFDDTGAMAGELSFKLRLRAAWLLGNNAEERKELMRTVQALYDCRSKAVHTGKLDSKVGNKPTDLLLKEGYTLVARVIESIAKRGSFPDWNQVVLG